MRRFLMIASATLLTLALVGTAEAGKPRSGGRGHVPARAHSRPAARPHGHHGPAHARHHHARPYRHHPGHGKQVARGLHRHPHAHHGGRLRNGLYFNHRLPWNRYFASRRWFPRYGGYVYYYPTTRGWYVWNPTYLCYSPVVVEQGSDPVIVQTGDPTGGGQEDDEGAEE
jgi:hypothetical protein